MNTLNEKDNLILEFAAISDIHLKNSRSIETERLEKAIKLSYEITSNLDLLVVSGDFTDGGHDPQHAQFIETINTLIKPNTKVIVNQGNHENGRFESDSFEYFRQLFGYGVDYMFQIKGFYFITLGVHHGDKYLDSQSKWLKTKLKIASLNNNKPIFVLTHYPARNTVIKSIKDSKDTFNEVLNQYPQVINISGHTHQALNDPRVIHQEHFTSFNNGSLSYLILNHYDYHKDYEYINKGHFAIFKVYDTKIIIERHIIDDNCSDAKSTKIPDDFVIDLTKGINGFTYKPNYFDKGTSPYFTSLTKVSVVNKNEDAIISFNQAKDDVLVYYYTISIKDLNSGLVVSETKHQSQFYENVMPEILSNYINFHFIKDKEYEIKIVAYNVNNRPSEPISHIFKY